MRLLKETPFEIGWRTWISRPGQLSMTIVVKATFALAPGDLELTPEQLPPEGERWIDDDIERALASPSELTPFKRRGECFVLGHCHPPDAPVPRSQAAFQIGPVQKVLAVFGDRSRRTLSAPEPLLSMPLTWERARRDPGLNPVGIEIPNLENPQDLIQGPEDRPTPVGFGPIARTWPIRRRLAGTYDAAWLANGYPGLAEDIDWEYFMAAPPDQRIEGYWRGDEEIVLVNLVAGQPSLRARLPGIRPRAFLIPADASDPWADLWEAPLSLDTIVVDGDARAVRCVWRAMLDVADAELSEMGALGVLHDEAGQARDLEACRALFREADAREVAEKEAFLAEAPPPSDAHDPILTSTSSKWADYDQAMTMQSSQPTGLLKELALGLMKGGVELDPASVLGRAARASEAPVPTTKLDERWLRAIEKRVLDEEDERAHGAPQERREQVLLAVNEGRSCAGWDLSDVDLSKLRISGGDFRGARFVGASFAGSIFGGTVFDGATFEEVELSDAQLEGATFVGATFHLCRLERAHFGDVTLDGAAFTECLMRGVRLRRTFAAGAEIADSRLDGATFEDSILDAVDFTGSTLDGALFARTQLRDARLADGVHAKGMRLKRCYLEKLRAGESDMSGSVFAACVADGARFGDANLAGVDFSFSELTRATFTGADLRGAKLVACRLANARFDGAQLSDAKLIRADLREARFESADLSGADLRGANLYAAELLDAQLEGAQLDLADLAGTRLA